MVLDKMERNFIPDLLSDEEKRSFWERVQSECPDDRMLQEFFYLKLIQNHLAERLEIEKNKKTLSY